MSDAPIGVVGMLAERAFSKPRAEELAKTEYEFILPDKAQDSLYLYITRGGIVARRYWSLPGKLLVGGNIRDHSDALHLASTFGVTHVLSWEKEFSDESLWSQSKRANVPFDDNRLPPPLPLLIRCVQWVRKLPTDAVLYVHCHSGANLAPTCAYLVLRVRHHMTRASAQQFSGRRPGGDPLFKAYLDAVDSAILKARY